MHKRRKSYGRRAAAVLVCACAQVSFAATPTYNSGSVTIIHDLDVTDSSTASTRYKTVNVTPGTTAPGSYSLDTTGTPLTKTVGANTGTSTATASVVRVTNSTNTGLTLAAGTGVSQKDTGHILGNSSLRFNINDMKWTPNSSFGAPAFGYISIIVGGVVNGTAAFNGNLSFKDQYNNPLRPNAILGPSTFTSSGQLPQAFTSQILFTPSAVTASSQIRINGYLEFLANNGIDDTVSSPIDVDMGGAPPTATYYSNAGGNWENPALWAPPPGSIIEDPDGLIPVVPNGVDHRARIVLSGRKFDPTVIGGIGTQDPVFITNPLTLGTLDVDYATDFNFGISGTADLTMQTSNPDVAAVIMARKNHGTSGLALGVDVNLASSLQVVSHQQVIFGQTVQGPHAIEKIGLARTTFTDVSATDLTIGEGEVRITGTGDFDSIIIAPGASMTLGDGFNPGGSVNSSIVNNGQLILNRPDSFTLDNPVSGVGALIHQGSGTTTFTGNKSYTGQTIINSGAVVLATNVSSTHFQINGGSLVVQTASPFAPNTRIDLGGALDVTSQSPFSVPNTMTINGFGGTVYGNVALSGGNIQPGGKGAAADITFNNDLNISGGNIAYDLADTNTIGSGVNDLVNVTDNLALNSGNIIVEFQGNSSGAGTSYRLINYGGSLTGVPTNLNLVNNSRAQLALTNPAAGQIDLQVITPHNTASLVWTGATSTWDVNGATNWLNVATPDKFYSGDAVTFNNTGIQTTLNLVGDLRPASVVVNSTTNHYNFGGSGRIVGPASFTKSGTSTLFMPNNHAYTGPTTINGGIYAASNIANGSEESSLGASDNSAGNLVLNGGQLLYNGVGATTDRLFSVGTSGGSITASGVGVLNWTNPDAMGFNGQTGARTLTLAGSNGGANTLAAAIGDNGGATSLVKTDSGKWVLTGSNTYTGTTAINSGKLIVNGTHIGGGGYTIANSGGLGGHGSIDANVFVGLGGEIDPGDHNLGLLEVNTLSLNTSYLRIDLANGMADGVTVIADNGLTLSGTTQVSLTDQGGMKPGVYSLIDYEGSPLANLSNFSLFASTFGNFDISLSNNVANTSVDLLVQRGISLWQGGNGNWSTPVQWNTTVPNRGDHIAVFGVNNTSPAVVNMDVGRMAGLLRFDTPNSVTIGGAALLTLDATGTDAGIEVLQGSHTIAAPLQLNMATTVNVVQAASLLNFTGPVNSANAFIVKDGLGTAQFKKIQTAGLVVYKGQVNFAFNPTESEADGTSVIRAFDISPGASVNLNNNALIVNYDPTQGPTDTLLNSIRTDLLDGWLTSSLNSATLRIGYLDNDRLDSPFSNFAGVSVDVSSVLINQTFAGDLDMNGTVDFADLEEFAVHYLETGKFWQNGDFTYDGLVDDTDLGFFALTWQGPGSLEDAFIELGLPTSAIPEPAILGLILPAMALTARRSRRR